MNSSKRMIEDLRELAMKEDVDEQAFRRLMASAIADVAEKLDSMCATELSDNKTRDEKISEMGRCIDAINGKCRIMVDDMAVLRKEVEINPSIRFGKLWLEYPVVVRVIVILILFVITTNGLQAVIELTKGILGLP